MWDSWRAQAWTVTIHPGRRTIPLVILCIVLFRRRVGRHEFRVGSTISVFKIERKTIKQFVKGHRLEKVESLIRLS